MAITPLDDKPKVRKVLYNVQWVINGVAAVLGAYFTITQTPVEDLPQWYVIPLGVLPVLWTYLGVTAQAHVDTTPKPVEGGPLGHGDDV